MHGVMSSTASVLVFHPKPEFRARICQVLSSLGLRGTEFPNPETRVAVSDFADVIGVLVDLSNVSGSESIGRRIREFTQTLAGHSLPVVGVIPKNELQLAVAAMKAGVSELLSEGDSQVMIRSILQAALQKRAMPSRTQTPAGGFESNGAVRLSGNQIRSFDEYEEAIFRFALGQSGGCVSRAAEALGVGRATMYRKMRSYQIEVPPLGQRRRAVSQVAAYVPIVV
jgi:DNA-binding NtrC family response regulator